MSRVISFHYTLTDPEGQQLDSSRSGDPFAFLEGVGQIVPGLEEVLVTLNTGDKQVVNVVADKAYGPRQDELVIKVKKEQFPSEEIKVGDQVQAGDAPGMPLLTIVAIEGDEVTLDANHPLAGVDLTFDVEITEVRDATEEEKAHGHAHGVGGHHH